VSVHRAPNQAREAIAHEDVVVRQQDPSRLLVTRMIMGYRHAMARPRSWSVRFEAR
jgi:hypothetical protein